MTTSETSSRMLVVFGDPEADAAAALRDIAGISRVRSTADFHGQAIDMSDAASAQARVTAVGRPRDTSPAKLGPDRTAAGAPGRVSASTSVISFIVPRSTPLEQSTTGTPAR